MNFNLSNQLKALSLATILIIAFSCTPDVAVGPSGSGYLSLSLSAPEQPENGRTVAEQDYKYLVVSIKNEEGEYVLNNETLALVKLGNGYFTENIQFEVGEYTIEDFIVLDSKENAVLICPKEGSDYAQYVEDALPLSYTVNHEETLVKSVEVLDATMDDPARFGYTILTFNYVQLVNLQDGLLAHYDFDGDASDLSGNGYHGEVFGASLTASRRGHANQAYRFNGSTDYIETGIADSVLTGLERFSFGCWVKLDSLNNTRQVMISNTRDGNGMFTQRIEDNQITTGIYNKLDSSTYRWSQIKVGNAQQSISQHTWYHFVTVYDGNILRLYVNGHELSTKAVTGPLARQGSISRTIKLGSNADKRAQYMLEGVLDEVRIYSRALSSREVQAWYSIY
ncbi:MAG: LamG domain-containing protein [Cyclobacteriaceae bacterium]